jgi:hypothetical protein
MAGRPKADRSKVASVHLGIRLTPPDYAALVNMVIEENNTLATEERANAQAGRAHRAKPRRATPSSVIRKLIRRYSKMPRNAGGPYRSKKGRSGPVR